MTITPDSFSAIYDNYAAALYGNIIRKVDNEERANIIFEKVFALIFSSFNQYCPQHSTLFTWMMAIAQKEILAAKEAQVL